MIKIRTVKPSELDFAKNFIRSIFPEAMVQITDDDTVLLAEDMGQIVGFAHVVDDGDRILLQGIGVQPSMRGQGVGTILLEYVMDSFKDTEKPIFLKVKAMNQAIDLYLRYGFMLQKYGDKVHVLVKKQNS